MNSANISDLYVLLAEDDDILKVDRIFRAKSLVNQNVALEVGKRIGLGCKIISADLNVSAELSICGEDFTEKFQREVELLQDGKYLLNYVWKGFLVTLYHDTQKYKVVITNQDGIQKDFHVRLNVPHVTNILYEPEGVFREEGANDVTYTFTFCARPKRLISVKVELNGGSCSGNAIRSPGRMGNYEINHKATESGHATVTLVTLTIKKMPQTRNEAILAKFYLSNGQITESITIPILSYSVSHS